MPRYGTLALSDLLELGGTTIESYGEQRLLDDIRVAMNGHNASVMQQINDIGMDVVTDRIRSYGESGTVRGRMHRVDEFGLNDVQKVRKTVQTDNLGFPLERWEYVLGFTRDYIQRRSPRDAAQQVLGAQEADLDRIEYEVRFAFFSPSNVLNYYDYWVDDLQIPVRRLHNGDSTMIPSYRGKTFNGATHTHYVGRVGAALADADITALLNNVIEHGVRGPVELWINLEDEPLLASFANFYEFDPVELVNLSATGLVPRNNPRIDTINPDDPENRAIGRWQAKYTIRTKPWVFPGYAIAVDVGRRPLAWRVPDLGAGRGDVPTRRDLRMVAEWEIFPLRAQVVEREFGIGTQDRSAAAVIYFGGTSYVIPTFTLPAV